ncbi:hypothetical protein ACFVYF_07460 [Streptomyces sp. NPDC058274]|jgi:hypothetical protein|uniref:hypothetical protein n=1 Tax=Streptomyces sp. NPDC058274 TaxID=3346416 RepID=UPI0036F03EAB
MSRIAPGSAGPHTPGPRRLPFWHGVAVAVVGYVIRRGPPDCATPLDVIPAFVDLGAQGAVKAIKALRRADTVPAGP